MEMQARQKVTPAKRKKKSYDFENTEAVREDPSVSDLVTVEVRKQLEALVNPFSESKFSLTFSHQSACTFLYCFCREHNDATTNY